MEKKKFDRAAGHRFLDSWVIASIIELATRRFCERFLDRRRDPTGRQYDQMTQAARSGRANIVEGAGRTDTSKESEMKLTDVARASLRELEGDFECWLMETGQAPWHRHSDEAKRIYNIWLDRPLYGADYVHDSCVHILEQQKKFATWLDSGDSTIVANCLLILIRRTIKMLSGQLETQVETFEEKGGFREHLTELRVEARAKKENAPDCPLCGKPMKKRKATTGKYAGTEFWGCTGYPECNGTRKVESN
jgi:four helix bundle suffix protein